MTAPFQHLEVARLMGSWPLAPSPSLSTPVLLPNALSNNATILGLRRAATYAVSSLSFVLWLDPSGGGAAVAHTIAFPPATYTLNDIISLINTDVANVTPPISEVVAYNDNGFLRLRSPRAGANSYLRLESIGTAEAVFNALGLFSGVESRGGELQQAQHVDPSRQVASPGQLSWPWGESLGTDVLNRSVFQLGWNSDLARGVIDRRPFAIKREETIVVTAPVRLNTGSPTQGVWVGPNATPTTEQLRDVIKILDANGNEYARDVQLVLGGPTANFTAAVQVDTDKQLINSPTVAFSAGDVADSIYVLLTGITIGQGDALENIPLKVIEYISATQVVVQAVVPGTGAVVPLTALSGTMTGSRIRIYTARAQVDSICSNAGLSTRVEQAPVLRESRTVTRVELNNRIYCAAGQFETNSVAFGDVVTWASAGTTDPFSNNGMYRVGKVIDERTLELLSDSFGPVFLNPNTGGGLGTVTINSDGDFWPEPYIKFTTATAPHLAAGHGATPANGETIRVVYLVANNVRDAIADSPAAFTPTVRYDHGASAEVQRVLMRLLGPSVTSFDEVLYGENWDSLEKTEQRLDKEHYEYGRHRNIRPDTIDMFPGVAGVTGTWRSNSGVTAPTGPVVRYIDANSGNVRWAMNSLGHAQVGANGVFAVDAALGEGGGSEYPHTAVKDAVAARSLLQGPSSVLALDATSSPSGTAYVTDPLLTSVRFWLRDGSPKRAFRFGHTGSFTLPDHILRLDLEDDGNGVETKHLVVFGGVDGFVGVGMGAASGAGAPVTGVLPQAPFHIRGRDNAQRELFRLEGADTNDPTVAMVFKPRLDLPAFAFEECDHDGASGGAGDWTVNYVLTADMDTDSDGAFTEGYFRWVFGASGFLGTERMRLRRGTLELTPDKSTLKLLEPGFRMGLPLQAGATVQKISEIGTPLTGGSAVAGIREFLKGSNTGVQWVFNANPDDALEATWTQDVNTTGSYRFEFLNASGLDVGTTGSNVACFRMRMRHHDVASPFGNGSWVTPLEILLPDSAIDQYPTRVKLSNGVIQFVDTRTEGKSSNPAYGTTGLKQNALCAKNTNKFWASFINNAGTLSAIAGYNVVTIAISGFGVRITLDQPIAHGIGVTSCIDSSLNSNTGSGIKVYAFTTSSTQVDVFVTDSAGVVIDMGAGGEFHSISVGAKAGVTS